MKTCRFGKGYTLQVKIQLPDADPNQVDSAVSKKSLLSRSRPSLISGSATRIPTGDAAASSATDIFKSFIHETFQYAKLIEEHQVAM